MCSLQESTFDLIIIHPHFREAFGHSFGMFLRGVTLDILVGIGVSQLPVVTFLSIMTIAPPLSAGCIIIIIIIIAKSTEAQAFIFGLFHRSLFPERVPCCDPAKGDSICSSSNSDSFTVREDLLHQKYPQHVQNC